MLPPVTVLLVLVAGWCFLSALLALGLGPFLHRAALLAERHEAPPAPAPATLGSVAA